MWNVWICVAGKKMRKRAFEESHYDYGHYLSEQEMRFDRESYRMAQARINLIVIVLGILIHSLVIFYFVWSFIG